VLQSVSLSFETHAHIALPQIFLERRWECKRSLTNRR
jgi:hypothetical protein